MERAHWLIAAGLLLVGFLVSLAYFVRRRDAPGARICPKCGYDLRGTPSLRCSECGLLVADEAALVPRRRRWRWLVLGLLVAIAFPTYRGVLWSRSRGWTPPLPAWKVAESRRLSNGAVVTIVVPRIPWEFGGECRIRNRDGATQTLEDEWFYLGDGSDEGRGVDEDITGDGVPDLAVFSYSGGAHCCLTYHLFGLPADGTAVELASIDLEHGGTFSDLDGDGVFEVVTCDWSWAYAVSCFACINHPEVVLRFTGTGYEMAPELMAQPAPTDEAFSTLVTDLSLTMSEVETVEYDGTRDRMYSEMLELIYTGHEERAWRLFDAVRPPGSPQRDEDLTAFRDVLEASPYREALRKWLQ